MTTVGLNRGSMNNKTKEEVYDKTSQILLGLECLYPEQNLIPRVRFALESLTFHEGDHKRILSDFFSLIKDYRDLPITPHFEYLVEASDPRESVIAIFRCLEHLSYDPQFATFRLLISQMSSDQGRGEEIHKLLIRFLTELSERPEFEYVNRLKSIFLETSSVLKIKKLLEFYIYLYEDAAFINLLKAYEHFADLNSELQFYQFLYVTTKSDLFNSAKIITSDYPTFRLQQALSKGQVRSKVWLRDKLVELKVTAELKNILVLCGWAGGLSRILSEKIPAQYVSVDIDPDCFEIAKRLNKLLEIQGEYKSVTQNIFDLNLSDPQFFNDLKLRSQFYPIDLVINTSCEHIADFSSWYNSIPDGQLLVLQSNDFFDCKEHLNCSKDLDEFKASAPMKELLFAGELNLQKYNRFMLIGRK